MKHTGRPTDAGASALALPATESAAAGDDPRRLEALFRTRAARLAGRRDEAGARRSTRPALVFDVAGETFALELTALAGIVPAAGITPVPLPPPGVRGVCVRDGELVSAIEASAILELHPSEGSEAGYLLFLREDATRSGLLVEGVERIMDLEGGEDADDGDPGDRPPGPRPEGLLRGVTPDGVRVLDAAALLAHPLLGRASLGPDATGGEPHASAEAVTSPSSTPYHDPKP